MRVFLLGLVIGFGWGMDRGKLVLEKTIREEAAKRERGQREIKALFAKHDAARRGSPN